MPQRNEPTAAKTTQCQTCGLHTLCHPVSLHADELSTISQALAQPPALHSGNLIFQTDEPMQAIFAIRSGAVKTTQLSEDGEESVLGFYLPGEVIGLDSLGQEGYASNAIALTKTLVCRLPINQLHRLSQQIPSLQKHVFQLMSSAIRSDYQRLNLLTHGNAEQRLISFLMSMAQRQAQRLLSAEEIHLPMSRADLANHLGLASETVSRVLTQLGEQQLIEVSGKHITLLDSNELRARLHGHCPHHA